MKFLRISSKSFHSRDLRFLIGSFPLFNGFQQTATPFSNFPYVFEHYLQRMPTTVVLIWFSFHVSSQGVDTTDTRKVSTKVPLAQVPYIMRALGFYPSEQEVGCRVCKNRYKKNGWTRMGG